MILMALTLNAVRMLGEPQPSGNHGFPFSLSCSEEERRLDVEEKPLVVQLNWNKDDREGRFVLKNENDAAPPKVGPAPSSSGRRLLPRTSPCRSVSSVTCL